MRKNLLVGIKGADESAKEFVEAWRRPERGERIERPSERLYFEDLAAMLKVLTPGRLELLRRLHESGPSSVRALAGRMRRDYKNVHHDLQVLERVRLVTRLADGRLCAPWKKIIAEIALAA